MSNDPQDAKSEKLTDWQELTRLTQGRAMVVERVRLAGAGMTGPGMAGRGIAIEGAFELPQLAQLSAEDQVFVTAFLRSHGSIKEMEQVFGVSYPTIKARLARIAGSLKFVEENPLPVAVEERERGRGGRGEILQRLQRGEITAEEAIREMEKA
jgi:hypothetical protein